MVHFIKSISEFHQLMELPKPKHPLISVIDLQQVDMTSNMEVWGSYRTEFYTISVKSGVTGKLKYGQNQFDFDEGVLMCVGPNQVLSVENIEEMDIVGYALTLNPDFLLHHPLAKKIKEYDFFSYQVNEALHLSDDEQQIIFNLFEAIKTEYENNMDNFSQQVILSNIDLLLVHINRYYNRQFITRKNFHNNLVSQVENILSDYYKINAHENLPTVQYLADNLHLSAAYLSDMLKSYTGLSAQQHIHESVITKAKELLTITELSISEIAYKLGFQHPQSFTKLFKQKTNISPLKYRQSFN
ncbi:MAG: helix-turn-helix transcriptional regulator [Carboxylicivirga sp.]|jgi:AraC-like DNA-binding protein|nr:helix-turn-helix transcriptional regulator [Carboxylicivirga sp.]